MAKVKNKYSRDRLIKTWDDHVQGYEFEIDLVNKMIEPVILPFPFGCATPITSFYNGKEVVKWLDHNGNEI